MINLANVKVAYSNRILFQNANFLVRPGDKIGLVGPNGAGKTTVFRLIMGHEKPDEGEVNINAGLVLGYVGGAPSYIRGHRATTGAEQGPRVSFRGEPQRAHDEVLALYRHHCHVCARFPADRRGVQPYASALAKEGFRVARKLMQVGEGEKARELLDLHELASHSPRLRADRASLRALARVVGERRAATWHERAYDWVHDLRRGGRR